MANTKVKGAKATKGGAKTSKGGAKTPVKGVSKAPVKGGDKIHLPASRTQGPQVVAKGYVPVLQKKYREEIAGKLMKEFGYTSCMQVPRLEKIVVNQGIGAATGDRKFIEVAENELSTISGQKAVPTVSKKDVSNFKLRRGMPIGVKVTLRGAKMYEFLDRLISIALPRIRDFKGIPEKFDGRGNYTLGIREQIIFPEIDIDKITRIFGMEMTFVTTSEKDEEAFALLREFGLPFRNIKKQQ